MNQSPPIKPRHISRRHNGSNSADQTVPQGAGNAPFQIHIPNVSQATTSPGPYPSAHSEEPMPHFDDVNVALHAPSIGISPETAYGSEAQVDHYKRKELHAQTAQMDQLRGSTHRDRQTQFAPSTSGIVFSTPETWWPVLLLAMVSLLAAGLAIWITQAPRTTSNEEPSFSQEASSSPNEWQLPNDQIAKSDVQLPFPPATSQASVTTDPSAPVKFGELNRPVTQFSTWPHNTSTHSAQVDLMRKPGLENPRITKRNEIATLMESAIQSYPKTKHPTPEWNLPSIKAPLKSIKRENIQRHESSNNIRPQRNPSLPEIITPQPNGLIVSKEYKNQHIKTATKPSGPIATFQGTIETPNLRAYHDRQQSSVY